MGIGMVVFWALLPVGIVTMIRDTTADQQRPVPPPPTSPNLLWADRSPRGEISEAQYRQGLAVLRDHARN